MEKKKKNQQLDKDRDYPFIELTEGPTSLFHKYYALILNRECYPSAVVFTVLVTFVNREDGRDKGKAFPGIKTIQAYFGGSGERGRGYISEGRITKCTEHLEKRGFLTERKRGRAGQSMRYSGRIPSRFTFLQTFGVDLERIKSAKKIENVFDENLKYLIDNIPESRRQKILFWLFDSDKVYEYCSTEPYLNRVLEPDLNNVIEPNLNRVKNIKDKNVKEINIKEKDSSIYSGSATDSLQSSSKKPYSNLTNTNLFTDNGFPAATTCIFGDPPETWKMVQNLAKEFQAMLIAEGFVQADWFKKSEKWWKINYGVAEDMVTEKSVDYWIGILKDAIHYYHHRDPEDKAKRDSSFDFVPNIRNLKGLVSHLPVVLWKRRCLEEKVRGDAATSDFVDAYERRPSRNEKMKEDIQRKMKEW